MEFIIGLELFTIILYIYINHFRKCQISAVTQSTPYAIANLRALVHSTITENPITHLADVLTCASTRVESILLSLDVSYSLI